MAAIWYQTFVYKDDQ